MPVEVIPIAEEKNFENRIKRYLKEKSCWYLKYWSGGGFTKSGIPDLLICCNGRFIGCEVKASNGKPTVLQIAELRKIHTAGGIGILLYPKDFDIFKSMIDAYCDGDDFVGDVNRIMLEEHLHEIKLE